MASAILLALRRSRTRLVALVDDSRSDEMRRLFNAALRPTHDATSRLLLPSSVPGLPRARRPRGGPTEIGRDVSFRAIPIVQLETGRPNWGDPYVALCEVAFRV
jgi:hypothetical protein